MAHTIRSLLGGVVGGSSSSCEEDASEDSDEGFETPAMEEFLTENQTADEL